jgi:hypothetical protein
MTKLQKHSHIKMPSDEDENDTDIDVYNMWWYEYDQ